MLFFESNIIFSLSSKTEVSHRVYDVSPHLILSVFFEWNIFSYGEVYEDYVKITDENYVQIGLFCGKSIGKTVFVGGRRARITFHTNQAEGRRGFLLLFTFVYPSKWSRGDNYTHLCSEIGHFQDGIISLLRPFSLFIFTLTTKILFFPPLVDIYRHPLLRLCLHYTE